MARKRAATSGVSPVGAAGNAAAGTKLTPGGIRPTRRMLVVPTLGLILWGAGSNAGASFLVVLAGGLLASIPWAWFSVSRAAKSVVVHRVLPTQITAGQDADLVLQVRVRSDGAVVVHDAVTGSVGVLERSSDGGTLTTSGPLGRGLSARGTVTVELADPFGLFKISAAGEVPGTVDVLPAVRQVVLPALMASAQRAADARPRRRGSGSETDGTRAYRHGDSPRSVHWRSSARRDALVVREFIGDSAALFRATIEPGAWQRGALDQACEAAASFCEAAQRAGGQAQVGFGTVAVDWSTAAHRQLASLTPNLGAASGRGQPSVEVRGGVASSAHVELVLRAKGAACEVALGSDGTPRALGAFPVRDLHGGVDAAAASGGGDVGTWLSELLRSAS